MIVPQLTEGQVVLLKEVCFDQSLTVFSQSESIPEDALPLAISMTQAGRDAEILATLGVLKDISGNHQADLDAMKTRTGRGWKVYEVPLETRLMFSPKASTTIH